MLIAALAVIEVGCSKEEPSPTAHWHSRDMVVVDRGDPAFDVLGQSRRVGNNIDDVRVILLDGQTGTPKWESATIGSYLTTDGGFVARGGDVILFTHEREIRGFALGDGSQLWRAELPTRVERLCDQGETILAISVDGIGRPIGKRDGALLPGAVAPACTPLLTDTRDPRSAEAASEAYEMVISEVVNGSVRVLAGRSTQHLGRSRGSGLATLVAVEESGSTRWRVQLPEDPEAPAAPPIAVTVGPHEVCAVYRVRTRSLPVGIACFAATDGERLWSDGIEDWNVAALAITGRTLLISRSGKLEVRELDTGVPRWQFGN